MIGWIDGGAGASGDMLLGALVDVGVPIDVLRAPVESLGVGVTMRAEPAVRGGLGATRVVVEVSDDDTHRSLSDIETMLERLAGASEAATVVERAIATFRRLAAAEAAVHRVAIDDVHFHEVGALDALADIVGACAGFVHLGLDELHCSTLSLGSGATRGAHGPIPVPAPAVLEILSGHIPVVAGPAPFESTTPTGAALLAEWVTRSGVLPSMTIDAVGMGAGGRDSDAVVNALRLVVGAPATSAGASMIEMSANIDDLDPRAFPAAIAAAMEAGAVDAWVTPIVMKKGRPAHTFSALCTADVADEVAEAIFTSTTSIGVRHHVVDRVVLERSISSIEVSGQRIGVKTAMHRGEVVNRSVEWDDVVAAADRLGRPARAVLAEATAELHAQESDTHPG